MHVYGGIWELLHAKMDAQSHWWSAMLLQASNDKETRRTVTSAVMLSAINDHKVKTDSKSKRFWAVSHRAKNLLQCKFSSTADTPSQLTRFCSTFPTVNWVATFRNPQFVVLLRGDRKEQFAKVNFKLFFTEFISLSIIYSDLRLQKTSLYLHV